MGLLKKIASAMGLARGSVRILVVGLGNSGKSTLVDHIKPNKASAFEATPTVGFQVEEFSKNDLNFTVFDMSGQSRYRALWEHYFCDAQAIIFVVDSTDRVRMCVVKEELEEIVKHKEVQSSKLPILVFANKMDLPGAMSPREFADKLGLEGLDGDQTPWHIERSNALVGSGVEQGVEWLAQTLRPVPTSSSREQRRRSSSGSRKSRSSSNSSSRLK